eukprot:6835000-Pyramimonas_sp.AAC.1
MLEPTQTASSEFQLTQNLAQMHCKLQKTGGDRSRRRDRNRRCRGGQGHCQKRGCGRVDSPERGRGPLP